VLTIYQEFYALLKLCLAGTASDSINPTQAIMDFSSSNKGRLLNQVCSSFEESKPFEG